MRQSSIDTAVRIRERAECIRRTKELISIVRGLGRSISRPISYQQMKHAAFARRDYLKIMFECSELRREHLAKFEQYETKNVFQLLWSMWQIHRLEWLDAKLWHYDKFVESQIHHHMRAHGLEVEIVEVPDDY